MKNYSKILIVSIFLYIFSIANCFAEYNWKKITTTSQGDNYYVDMSSIKRSGDNVFFLKLRDYLKPDKWNDLSNVIYHEVNCVNLDFKFIKDFYYTLPMGNGKPSDINNKVSGWEKTPKDSTGEIIFRFVCNLK